MKTADTANRGTKRLTRAQLIEGASARRYAAIPRHQRGETAGERAERWRREGPGPQDKAAVRNLRRLNSAIHRPVRMLATAIQQDCEARPNRKSGHAPRPANNRRSGGSRRGSTTRSASRGGDSGDKDGESDPPGKRTPPAGRETAERPARPCVGCEERPDCKRLISKPARGPVPERCPDCTFDHNRAVDREHRRERREAEALAKAEGKRSPCTRECPADGYCKTHKRTNRVAAPHPLPLPTQNPQGGRLRSRLRKDPRPTNAPRGQDAVAAARTHGPRPLDLREQEWFARTAAPYNPRPCMGMGIWHVPDEYDPELFDSYEIAEDPEIVVVDDIFPEDDLDLGEFELREAA
jgi:hypothetical protein